MQKKVLFSIIALLLFVGLSFGQVSISGPNAICKGSSTSLIAHVSGFGADTLNYQWLANGSTFGAANNDSISVTPTSSTTYTVVVTTKTSGFVGTSPGKTVTLDSITATPNITPVKCFGGNTGAISVTINSGSGLSSVSWTGPNGFNSNSPSISGLFAGNYSGVFVNTTGCSTSISVAVTQPSFPLNTTTSGTNLNCSGNTGSVSVNVSGGTSPYSFFWSSGHTTQSVSGLTPGNYRVTVTDANGCSKQDSAVITAPQPLFVSVSASSTKCWGANNGSLTAFVTGGTTPYSYSWSNGGTTPTISGLAAGAYSVTVTDSRGCSSTFATIVTEPNQLFVTLQESKISCFGMNNGSLTAFASGGVVPYTWSWSTGDNTQTITSLAPGFYSVVVTDANGCTRTVSMQVQAPPALSVNAGPDLSLCANSGQQIIATATGGQPLAGGGYNWAWSTGANTRNVVAPLFAGVHTLTVTATDANGCNASDQVIVTVNNAVQPTAGINIVQISPNTWTFGSAAGHQAGWSYFWDFGNGHAATTPTATQSFAPGAYNVRLIVYNGCGADTAFYQVFVGATSIADLDEKAVSIYPNPSLPSGTVHLQLPNSVQGFEYEIVSLLGQKLAEGQIQGNETSISTPEQPGIYLIRIKAKNQTITKRLVISKN